MFPDDALEDGVGVSGISKFRLLSSVFFARPLPLLPGVRSKDVECPPRDLSVGPRPDGGERSSLSTGMVLGVLLKGGRRFVENFGTGTRCLELLLRRPTNPAFQSFPTTKVAAIKFSRLCVMSEVGPVLFFCSPFSAALFGPSGFTIGLNHRYPLYIHISGVCPHLLRVSGHETLPFSHATPSKGKHAGSRPCSKRGGEIIYGIFYSKLVIMDQSGRFITSQPLSCSCDRIPEMDRTSTSSRPHFVRA